MSLAQLYAYITESFPLLAGLPSTTTRDSATKAPAPARDQEIKIRSVTCDHLDRWRYGR